jgi:two-component system, NtrC family, sensor kinase
LFQNLSYRVKVPLALTAVILLTEIVLTAALLTRAFSDAKRDLRASANSLAKTLALTVREPLVKDELWRAYNIVQAPAATKDPSSPLKDIVVLDSRQRVYTSSVPSVYRVTAPASTLPTELRLALSAVTRGSGGFYFDFPGYLASRDAAAAVAVRSDDGSVVGYVLLSYQAHRLYDRVAAVLLEVVAISVPGLLVLLPLGWVWGNRIVKPLTSLAAVMRKVGREPPHELARQVEPQGSDETGQLASQFRRMLHQLDEKEQLERQVLVAERLAAVGRVSAGIAHEINNPLGGMLNAVDTLARHGDLDSFAHKTLGLLQRGLEQIRSTVGALLLEARLDSPALQPEDWQDLRTLIGPQLAEKQVRMEWDWGLEQALPLPAHMVRQLILNLLLNAVKAADAGGRISVRGSTAGGNLTVRIANSGQYIPSEALERLFEPYAADGQAASGRTSGLGLWVSYQIVTRLGGTISTSSEPGYTVFEVVLPYAEGSDARTKAVSH